MIQHLFSIQLYNSPSPHSEMMILFLLHYEKYSKNCLFLEACLHMNICLLLSINVSVPILGNSISHICTRYHKPLPLKKIFLKYPLSFHYQYSISTGLFLSAYKHVLEWPAFFFFLNPSLLHISLYQLLHFRLFLAKIPFFLLFIGV